MRGWLIGLLLLGTALAYAPIRSAGFVFEDPSSVRVHRAQLAWPTLGTLAKGRWLSTWSYAANQDVAPSAESFHLVNLALHLVNGLLLAWWLTVLGLSPWAVLLGAGAFLVHPVNTEAVAYISGRTELLSVGCVLLALLALDWSLLLTAVALVLAVLAKESAIVGFPLVLLVAHARGRLQTREAAGVLAAGLCLGLVRAIWTLPDPYVWANDRGGYGYLAVQCAALWRYLALLVWPQGLTIDHDFYLVTPLIGSLALVGVLVWLAIACWGRWTPLVRVALLWPIVALVPRFFLRIPEFLNEHQFYLPMVGISLGLALIGEQACAMTGETIPRSARSSWWSSSVWCSRG